MKRLQTLHLFAGAGGGISERYPYVLAGYVCKLIEEIQATQRKEPTQ